MVISFVSWAVVYYVVAVLKPNGTDTLLNSTPDANGNVIGGTGSNVNPLKPQ
jgi:hypothetical protein